MITLGRRLRAALGGDRDRRRLPRLLAAAEHDWQAGLPDRWRDAVAAPLLFERALDYEVAAERLLGRDGQGQACYCSYQCVLTDLCCEDGDVFFEDLSFAEQVRAWRLRAGGWLVRRSVTTREEPEMERVDYHCSDHMPR